MGPSTCGRYHPSGRWRSLPLPLKPLFLLVAAAHVIFFLDCILISAAGETWPVLLRQPFHAGRSESVKLPMSVQSELTDASIDAIEAASRGIAREVKKQLQDKATASESAAVGATSGPAAQKGERTKMGGRLIVGLTEITFPHGEGQAAGPSDRSASPHGVGKPGEVTGFMASPDEAAGGVLNHASAVREARERLQADKLHALGIVKEMKVLENVGLVVLELEDELSEDAIRETVKTLWQRNPSTWLIEPDSEITFRGRDEFDRGEVTAVADYTGQAEDLSAGEGNGGDRDIVSEEMQRVPPRQEVEEGEPDGEQKHEAQPGGDEPGRNNVDSEGSLGNKQNSMGPEEVTGRPGSGPSSASNQEPSARDETQAQSSGRTAYLAPESPRTSTDQSGPHENNTGAGEGAGKSGGKSNEFLVPATPDGILKPTTGIVPLNLYDAAGSAVRESVVEASHALGTLRSSVMCSYNNPETSRPESIAREDRSQGARPSKSIAARSSRNVSSSDKGRQLGRMPNDSLFNRQWAYHEPHVHVRAIEAWNKVYSHRLSRAVEAGDAQGDDAGPTRAARGKPDRESRSGKDSKRYQTKPQEPVIVAIIDTGT